MNETKRILQLLISNNISTDEAITLINRYTKEEIEEAKTLKDRAERVLDAMHPLISDIFLLIILDEDTDNIRHWTETAEDKISIIRASGVKGGIISTVNLQKRIPGSISKIRNRFVRKMRDYPKITNKYEDLKQLSKEFITNNLIMEIYKVITKNPRNSNYEAEVEDIIQITRNHIPS